MAVPICDPLIRMVRVMLQTSSLQWFFLHLNLWSRLSSISVTNAINWFVVVVVISVEAVVIVVIHVVLLIVVSEVVFFDAIVVVAGLTIRVVPR